MPHTLALYGSTLLSLVLFVGIITTLQNLLKP